MGGVYMIAQTSYFEIKPTWFRVHKKAIWNLILIIQNMSIYGLLDWKDADKPNPPQWEGFL
jgi:hypothetical protein